MPLGATNQPHSQSINGLCIPTTTTSQSLQTRKEEEEEEERKKKEEEDKVGGWGSEAGREQAQHTQQGAACNTGPACLRSTAAVALQPGTPAWLALRCAHLPACPATLLLLLLLELTHSTPPATVPCPAQKKKEDEDKKRQEEEEEEERKKKEEEDKVGGWAVVGMVCSCAGMWHHDGHRAEPSGTPGATCAASQRYMLLALNRAASLPLYLAEGPQGRQRSRG